MTPRAVPWSDEIERRLAPHAGAYLAELRRQVETAEAWAWIWPGDVLTIVKDEYPAKCKPQLRVMAAEGRGLVEAWAGMKAWAKDHGYGVLTCATQKAAMVRLLIGIGWEPVAVEMKTEV